MAGMDFTSQITNGERFEAFLNTLQPGDLKRFNDVLVMKHSDRSEYTIHACGFRSLFMNKDRAVGFYLGLIYDDKLPVVPQTPMPKNKEYDLVGVFGCAEMESAAKVILTKADANKIPLDKVIVHPYEFIHKNMKTGVDPYHYKDQIDGFCMLLEYKWIKPNKKQPRLTYSPTKAFVRRIQRKTNCFNLD